MGESDCSKHADVRSMTVPMPPLAEQERIVAKIETLSSELNSTRERIDRSATILRRFRQAVLAAACSGKLTEDWRKNEHINMDGWKEATLEDVADMRLGKMLDQAKNVGTPTQYLRNVNVRWFSFELVDLFEMRATQQDKGEFSIKDGDLLVCEGGEPGRCAVWNLGSNDLIFQKAIHRIRLKDKISPHWVAFNLKNDADSGVLEEYFTGSGIKHMTGRSLATYFFKLPTMEEQREISDVLMHFSNWPMRLKSGLRRQPCERKG